MHIKLFPVTPVTGPSGRVSGQKDLYVPWVPRIVHETLTPGLPVGRPPRSPEGSPAKKIYVYVPFSFLTTALAINQKRPDVHKIVLSIPSDTKLLRKIIPWELFFVIFEGIRTLKISRKERLFPEITREIRNFSKTFISK